MDATNIIEKPELVISTITSIGLDHQDVLGETKEEISAEKAGVIKSGVPCVVGPTCDLQPIADRAKEMGVELTRIPKHEMFTKDNIQIASEILKYISKIENRNFSSEIEDLINNVS